MYFQAKLKRFFEEDSSKVALYTELGRANSGPQTKPDAKYGIW